MPPKEEKVVVATSEKQTQNISNGEVKYNNSYYDKQSGSYGRVTTKKSVSSGDYTNRGRTGHKDEFKSDSTVRIGDKGGYTEYSRQEKFTIVDYGKGNNNDGGNKVCGGSSNKADSNNDYDSDDDDDDAGNGIDLDDDDAACGDGKSYDGGCSDDCYGSVYDDGGFSDCYYDSDD